MSPPQKSARILDWRAPCRHRESAASTSRALRQLKEPFNAGDHVHMQRRWRIRLLTMFKIFSVNYFMQAARPLQAVECKCSSDRIMKRAWRRPPAQVASTTVGQFRLQNRCQLRKAETSRPRGPDV